jgi:hypothetical protein
MLLHDLQRSKICGFIYTSDETKSVAIGDIPQTTEAVMEDTETTEERNAPKGDGMEVVIAAPQKPVVAVRREKTREAKKRRLGELEASIRRNMDVIRTRGYEVGAFLSEIDEDKLYRDTTPYRNFNDYCEATFGFSRQHAYRLINAARVTDIVKDMAPAIEIRNEAQARPLTKLLKDHGKLREAVRVIAKSDKSLTTRTVEAAVKQVTRPPDASESERQKALHERLPDEVTLLRWDKGTLATIRLDLEKYIEAITRQSGKA